MFFDESTEPESTADTPPPSEPIPDVPEEGAAPSSEEGVSTEEISSLLNPDLPQTGIHAIVNSDMVYYERLPMLEVVFDRLVRIMSSSLRNFTADNVDVSLDSIQTVRFGDYMGTLPMPVLINVVLAEEWDNNVLVVFDNDFIYTIVDVLLGGRRGIAPMEDATYTTIERKLMERMIQLFLNDLSAAFDPLCPVTFRHERQETNPQFAGIIRPSNTVVVVKIAIRIDDRNGYIYITLPYATIEPIRELLLQTFMGEKFGRDSIWESHLANQLWNTELELDAVLDELPGKLQDVLNWKVGSQIILNATVHSPIELKCAEYPMFKGQMGCKGGKVAVKVDKIFIGKKEKR